ncbi:MAG: TIGR03086 family protein, partial [Streptomyces sp.]|nr:TIGR03086 family protein [Streptomyces sp.]
MTVTEADIVELDRVAVREAVRVVDLARSADWERDTPCAGWTLRRLVAHMAAQHRGFAAAARGVGGEPAHWREPEDMGAPAEVHRAAAADLLDAFA